MSSVKGLGALQRQLISISKDVEQFVKDETEALGREIEADAKNNASSIIGAPVELKQRINSEVIDNGFGTKISQNLLPLGAYLEFGTGAFVQVSEEWKDMAWTFYKNGKGTLRATPYLYPAFVLNREKYIKLLRKKLELITK